MADLKIKTNSGTTASFQEEDLAELMMSLRGPLLRPEDAAYEPARHVYNGMFAGRHPGAILRARSTADVIDAVRFAANHDLVVAVRGGGHSVAGNSICDDGLIIDLTELNGIHLDRKAGTVRVQGGATWGDVDRETQAFGLATPGGVVSTTGIGGLTLNGGIGWLRNKHGLSCDNLVSAEVVTASGELITASAAENPDLFWALRGGGGNFGVVTSFEFKVHPVGPIVPAALVMYPLAEAANVLRKWRDWLPDAQEDITSNAIPFTVPVSEHMPPPVHGQQVLIIAGVYPGDVEEGLRLIQPLRELGTPLFDMSGPLPFRAMQSSFDFFFPLENPLISYWKSIYLNELGDDAIEILAEAANNRTSELSMINIVHLGKGVRSVGAKETAFGERTASFMISLDANWRDTTGDTARHAAWARSYWDRLNPLSTGGVYLNFVGAEDKDADKLVRSAFGAQL